MKKLIIAFVFAVLSTATFAQVKVETQSATPTGHKEKLHCYFMKDGVMTACWGTKGTPMTKDATLMNGTLIDTKGDVVMKNGKKATLKNGECILAENGKIGSFDKMHPKADHKM